MKEKIHKVEFRVRPGFWLSQDQADAYGPELERLASTLGHTPQPSEIVVAARRKDSPMHDYFEWDDRVGGKLHREDQARYVLRSLEITIRSVDIPAYHGLRIEREGGETERRYFSAMEILSDADLRRMVISDCIAYLKAWKKRASQYEELGKIRDVITPLLIEEVEQGLKVG